MFLLQSYKVAVIFCIVTMICWGSWANAQKLADKKWRYELFYWDYTLGVLATAIIFAMTWGSQNPDSTYAYQHNLSQAIVENPASLGWAFAGGVVFNIANILLVSAIDIAGLAVAFPVGIGLALVLGVLWNYINDPAASGNPLFLFLGVGLVAVAIVISALSYKKRDEASADPNAPKKPIGKGLALSILCGVLMSLFYLFVAKSLGKVVVDGELLELTHENLARQGAVFESGKLTPYVANLIFAVGVFVSTCVIMPILMRFPIVGEPVDKGHYWRGSLANHFWGWVGGGIWAIGMTFNVLAAGLASPAVAYGLGQGATLMSAIWGVFIWREFKGSPKGVGKMLAAMFVFFIVGLSLIVVTKIDFKPAVAVETETVQKTDETIEALPDLEEGVEEGVAEEGIVEEGIVEEGIVIGGAEVIDNSAIEETPGAVEEPIEIIPMLDDPAVEETPEVVEEPIEIIEEAPEVVEEAVEEFEIIEEPAVEEAPEVVEEPIEIIEEAPEAVEVVEEAVEEAPVEVEEAAEAVEPAEIIEEASEAVEEAPAEVVEEAVEEPVDVEE
jgi:glucose uptake protein